MNNPIKLLFLDGFRGLAAVYVMIGHSRALLWEGYSNGYLKHPQLYNLSEKLLVYFFGFFQYGLEVVLFFFVLSGFVIHLKYANRFKKDSGGSFVYTDFLRKRIKRIYPPFLIALLLTYFFDSYGAILGYNIYSESALASFTHNSDLKTLIGNIFFLYSTYVPIFGSNGPSWSLKFEWWFYMIYPFLVLISRKHIFWSTAIVFLLFVFSFFPLLWPIELAREIFSLMLAWWFGVILAEIYSRRLKVSYKYTSFLLLSFVLAPMFTSYGQAYYILIALGFTGLLSFCFYLQSIGFHLKFIEKFRLVGNFSFTLYISHFPLLIFLRGWWMKDHSGALPQHFFFVLAGILVTMMSAYLLHFITEIPFISSAKGAVRYKSSIS